MADTIDFADKDNSLPTSDPRKLIRAVDVNEIKDVVNTNASELEAVGTALDAVLESASASYDTFLEVGNKLTSLDSLKAPIASPTFTGTPAAPTAAAGTNTTQLSTTAFVTAAIAAFLARIVKNEVPSGSGTTRTIANTPVAGSVEVYDAVLLGSPGDYSITGVTIEFAIEPTNPLVHYIKA